MGAIADAMSRFAQPLIDATDGSQEQLQRALTLSQLCWNLAMTPEGKRDEILDNMQPALKMDDDELQEFKRTVVAPMIRRHQELFPAMQRTGATDPSCRAPSHAIPQAAPRVLSRNMQVLGEMNFALAVAGKSTRFVAGDKTITRGVNQLRAFPDTSLSDRISTDLALGTDGLDVRCGL